MKPFGQLRFILGFLIIAMSFSAHSITLNGTTDIHDPSTIVKEGNTYWTFGTGLGASNAPINALYSTDLINWSRAPSPIPPNTRPSWTYTEAPGFDGNFWAPDLIEMNGRYFLYYSAFSDRYGLNSAIGVMVTDSIANPNWQDLGVVVSTSNEPYSGGQPVNAIDPGLFRDQQGRVWMVYGSHYAGIFMREINQNTGKPLNSTRHPVVGNNYNWQEYEAAQVQYLNGYYYMFVNLGECCAGRNSTYYIVTGRSTSPTGPYLDRNGVDLWNYGGTNVLGTEGNYIGPGHFGFYNHGGQRLASIHYYDGTTFDGWPARLDLLQLGVVNGWPTFTRNYILNDINLPAANLPAGRVTFTARHSGKLMEVASGSQDNGADVVQWSANGSLNQQWDIQPAGDGYYTIRAAHSGKALDLYEWNPDDGADLRQWDFFGGDNQQWKFVDQGNGYYGIISRHSGKAADVFEFSTQDGGDVRQWGFWGGDPQLWRIDYVQ